MIVICRPLLFLMSAITASNDLLLIPSYIFDFDTLSFVIEDWRSDFVLMFWTWTSILNPLVGEECHWGTIIVKLIWTGIQAVVLVSGPIHSVSWSADFYKVVFECIDRCNLFLDFLWSLRNVSRHQGDKHSSPWLALIITNLIKHCLDCYWCSEIDEAMCFHWFLPFVIDWF